MRRRTSLGLSLLLLLLAAPLLLAASAGETATATLLWTKGQERQKLLLAWNGETLRIEQPEKRFVLLYRERDGLVIGLEARDAFYWKFEWPKIDIILKERKAVVAHFGGVLGETNSKPDAPPPPKPLPVWRPHPSPSPSPGLLLETPVGNDGEGTAPSDLLLIARCAAKEDKPQSALGLLWLRYAQAAEIVRTVALRELAPTGLADAVASLAARQTTPLEFRIEFRKIASESLALVPESWQTGVALDPTRFTVPKNYREMPLAPLEELMGNAPAPTPSPPAPTADLGPVQKESSP